MEPIVKNLHREIEQSCERTLGRPLAGHERRFITGRRGLIALESILDFVNGMDAGALERYLASEQSGGTLLEPAGPRPGSYLGTIVDGRWWKRYRREGLFVRGDGEWWLEGRTLCFRRLLSREPIRIDLDRVLVIETGTWHAGKWAGGRSVVKLTWKQEDRRLTAGFVLTATAAESWAIMEDLALTSRNLL